MSRDDAEQMVDALIWAAISHERETVAPKYTRKELDSEREKVLAALTTGDRGK